jgi:DNA-binding NtrC family response regulator
VFDRALGHPPHHYPFDRKAIVVCAADGVAARLVRKATDLPLSISDLPVEILLQLSGTEEEPAARKAAADILNTQTFVNSLVRVLEANDWNLARSLESCERHALEAAMERMRGNQSKTAQLLGITARSVYNKVRKYQLKP